MYHTHLYVKFQGKICGPLDYSQVAAQLAGGGFKNTDRGSFDRATWRPLSELVASELIATAKIAMRLTVLPVTRGRRKNAYFLDLVFNAVSMVIFAPVIFVVIVSLTHNRAFEALTRGFAPEDAKTLEFLLPLCMAIALLLFTALQIYLLVKRGATLGKLIMGLRVVALDEDGGIAGRPSVWSAVKRHVLSQAMFFCPPFGVIFNIPNFIMFLWRGARPLHDRWANTCVVDRNEVR